jgi:hypothetical protein
MTQIPRLLPSHKIGFCVLILSLFVCGVLASDGTAFGQAAQAKKKRVTITEAEVNAAQQAWCDGLVKIGKIYGEGGDYKAFASQFIDDTYDFADGRVFFRPTLAIAPQAFRMTKAGALAYFVGGNSDYPSDDGFALKQWVKASYDNGAEGCNGLQIHGRIAITMGNVYLTGKDGTEVTVDKVFVFRKDADGKLRLIVHKSALPN